MNSGVFALSLCGGNIGYEHLSGLTYNLNSTIWVCESVETLNVEIHFGDGTTELLSLSIETVYEGIYVANFSIEHTYPSAGNYDLFIQQPSLPNGLCNVPNSADQQMSILTRLFISPFFGSNVTPSLAPLWQFQIEDGWLEHALGTVDSDGDGLSYVFASLGIPGFNYPNGLELTAEGVIRYLPQ